MKYPQHQLARWLVLVSGLSIVVGATLIWSEDQWKSIDPKWMLFPAGMAAGLALGWWRKLSNERRDPPDITWRARDQLELYEIACRSVTIAPKLPLPLAALSMSRLLADAIRRGDLGCVGEIDDQKTNGLSVQIPYTSLEPFAVAIANDQLITFIKDWKPSGVPQFGDKLRLADVRLDVDELSHDQLGMTLRCFNGTPAKLSVQDIRGIVRYETRAGSVVALGTPMLTASSPVSSEWGGELALALTLNIPSELAGEIDARLSSGDTIVLDFSALTIACQLEAPVRETHRLPLWASAKFAKVQGQVVPLTRTFAATMSASAQSKVTVA